MAISSKKNPKIQWIRSLQSRSRNRRVEGAFVVEGVRLVEEGLNSGWSIMHVFHSENLSERGGKLVKEFTARGTKVDLVDSHVMLVISETKTPQGILAVMELEELKISEEADFFLVIDQLRDPGNLGTILRSAVSAGASAALLSPGCVDPFSPKVIRAGMGAHFKLPIRSCRWADITAQVNSSIVHTYLASIDRGEPYHLADFRQPIAIIIGSEAEGASESAHQFADSVIHIPMPGGGESLNAAVAAGILIFEAARQRGMST
jgi:TrmH family RNA methyltransferase